MNEVYVVRSPESDFRPEKWITQQVVKELKRRVIPHEVSPEFSFHTLNRQISFYDPASMIKLASKQMEWLLDWVKDGDVLYFADAWTPAILHARMYAQMEGIDLKICGLFHSSAAIEADLFHSSAWALPMEEALLRAMDRTFVATEYSVRKMHAKGLPIDRVMVTGLPIVSWNTNGVDRPEVLRRRHRVCFSHRWAEDKRPQDFIALAKMPELELYDFVVLHPVPLSDEETAEARKAGIRFIHCPDKKTYWNELCQCGFIFSSAELETFGYSVLEGVLAGAVPIVPNRACYPYMYSKCYRDLTEAATMIKDETFVPRLRMKEGMGDLISSFSFNIGKTLWEMTNA